VAALTPVGHRELLRETRDALIMAFTTGSLFAVLPLLTERSQVLLRRHLPGEGVDRLPEVIVPASFNFPHTGKIMSLSFILFAGWFSDAQVRIAEYPRLALTGIVTFFGSLNVAVPFLLDMLRIPADMFQIFLATGLISSRFGTLVAATHTVALAVLGSCAMSGALRVEPRRVGRWAILTAALAIVTFGGVRLLFGRVFPITYEKDKLLTEIAPLKARPPLATLPSAVRDEGGSAAPLIDRIRARGRIRVGYLEDGLPFAFQNARGELVGFDVEMAHELAGVLGVELELVTVSRIGLAEHLERGECDVVMSGIAVTPDRARTLVFSDPYLDETLALLVRDHRRHEFESWEILRGRGPLRIASPAGVSYYEEKVHDLLPEASVFHPEGTVAELLGPQADAFDAALATAERGSAWTLLYPRFSVVVPEGTIVKVPLAYPVARREAAFAAFLDTFIGLKRKDGTIDALYAHWILGRSTATRPRRWSILRDVLHWTE
jgi:ABC-type amino acid transport substrate-binding protein